MRRDYGHSEGPNRDLLVKRKEGRVIGVFRGLGSNHRKMVLVWEIQTVPEACPNDWLLLSSRCFVGALSAYRACTRVSSQAGNSNLYKRYRLFVGSYPCILLWFEGSRHNRVSSASGWGSWAWAGGALM